MASESNDLTVYHPAIGVVGRVMFTLIFFLSGVTHFTDASHYVSIMPAAMPAKYFWVWSSGIVELLGATLILFDRYPRLGGWLIVLFLVPVTATVHGALLANAADPDMQRIQQSFILKGITMTGAALLITQLGVTRRDAGPPR